jgi:maltooligosyltrehalose trehalohydrolase
VLETESRRGSSTARPLSVARRRLPIGAEAQPGGGVHFRVWAPDRKRVEVVLDGGKSELRLERGADGYWSGLAERGGDGTRYAFRLDGEDKLYPDPASRSQPEGPHGPSEVIDPGAFAWTDGQWKGLSLPGQVVYELHIGTFTREGTWQAAAERLPHLRELGVTAIEVMPVAEFPGRFGWGYDGVDLFAPYHGYGRPDDFRRFVDQAHQLGLGVLLDVVYNHFGPDGNYLSAFWPRYFSDKSTEWGCAINYDGRDAAPTRELVASNAAYWIDEYHLDGLRLDATQSIFDESPDHIVAELTRKARAAAGTRSILLFAENEPQEPRLVRPADEGGLGLDGLWNDDFHHTARVALTGRTEAYYTDYRGSPQEFISAAKYGYLFQGQWYGWQKQRRGRSARGVPPRAFAAYLENHDQVANSCLGRRRWQQSAPGRLRAITGLLLLGPWTPLLFQGQEWNASSPFLFFADHHEELARLVRAGRTEFLRQFPSCATPEVGSKLDRPDAPSTFERCRLDWDEPARAGHAQMLALYRDLLALRRSDPVIRTQAAGGVNLDGAVLGPEAFLLRYLAPHEADDRLLLINLGADLPLRPAPEPLLAPPEGHRWKTIWSSDDPRYGGEGTPAFESELDAPRLLGMAALLLTAAKVERSETSEKTARDQERAESAQTDKPAG